MTAAYAARLLGLPYNSPESVENCRSKLRQREVLRGAGLPVPDFFSFALTEPLDSVLRRVTFPVRGEAAAAVGEPRRDSRQRSRRIHRRGRAHRAAACIRRSCRSRAKPISIACSWSAIFPAPKLPLEGLLEAGQLRVLALFDKPDPLEGPYFEESIYVTPSRLPQEMQERISRCAAQSVRALGSREGPVHAEFRVNDDGPWVLEVAPRPIGGLCSRVLRFGPQRMFLEELLVRHALGLPGADVRARSGCRGRDDDSGAAERRSRKGGRSRSEAAAIPGINEIQITARLHDFIAAWPEGSSYLGFIFARGGTPDEAEAALREAHRALRFTITPRLPVAHPVSGTDIPVEAASGPGLGCIRMLAG